MRNPEKERIEAKLNLWNTPGFFQFIEDLDKQTLSGCKEGVANLKTLYTARLNYIKGKEQKGNFKQGDLGL